MNSNLPLIFIEISNNLLPGDWCHLCILYLHLHPLLLPKNPPGHEGPCHPERDGDVG